MAVPSSLKTPNLLHIFTMKEPSSSSSSLSSMKLKTLFQTFVFSHMYRITRAFAKAKSVLIELLGGIHFVSLVDQFPFKYKGKNNKKQKKLFFGSFRLHYNWCSSHVMPLGQECYSDSHVYYDSSWNTVINPTSYDKMEESSLSSCDNDELSKYLKWLEEKGKEESCSSCNEIDKLADMFIANCHEKFRLEKQESYRRFQEMMARSV
ncbi:hypothetical protein ABFX02_11G004400 [Erythranthe guttata]